MCSFMSLGFLKHRLMLLRLHSGCQLNAGSGSGTGPGPGPGPGAGVEVYIFFKECCFRVRTRFSVRVRV